MNQINSSRNRFNRSRSPLTASQRNDLIAKHVIVDREEMAKKLDDTKRFICYGCKFATDDEARAKSHRDWVKDRFEEDARQGESESMAQNQTNANVEASPAMEQKESA